MTKSGVLRRIRIYLETTRPTARIFAPVNPCVMFLRELPQEGTNGIIPRKKGEK